jgi:hypothetical protein
MKRSASFRPRRQSRREPEPRIIMRAMTVGRIQKSRKRRDVGMTEDEQGARYAALKFIATPLMQ